MGTAVCDCNFSAMGIDDRLAQGQAEPHAAAAVRDFGGGAVKHFEYMRLCFSGNAGTIVRDGNKDKIPLLFPLDTDIGTYRRIFYRVIDDIDEYLELV